MQLRSEKVGQLNPSNLEAELYLKQLQIRSLLTITQAINDNVSAAGLFEMYKNFLAEEMQIEKMALFVETDNQWDCVACINVPENLKDPKLIETFQRHRQLYTIQPHDLEVLQNFDLLIPVYHKKMAISFVLIGGFEREKDLQDKIQFITTITNIISVAIENKKLFKQKMRKELLQKEFALAEEVQRMMLPDTFPKDSRFNMDTVYRPHFNVGGDYFDWIQIDKDNFVFCIADISGKGVAAAILMANFQAIIKVVLRTSKDLKEVMRNLNKEVFEITKSDKFITFFLAKVNLASKQIEYINAGHNPPMLIENGNIRNLEKGTVVLGAVEDLPFCETEIINYQDRTLLFAFTDGLIDLVNNDGEHFSREMVQDFLSTNYKFSSKELNLKLMERLEVFREGKGYPDDIAILACQFATEDNV